MCTHEQHLYTVSHADLASVGIYINENGVNIPLNQPTAVVYVRKFADAVRKQAREPAEAFLPLTRGQDSKSTPELSPTWKFVNEWAYTFQHRQLTEKQYTELNEAIHVRYTHYFLEKDGEPQLPVPKLLNTSSSNDELVAIFKLKVQGMSFNHLQYGMLLRSIIFAHDEWKKYQPRNT